MSTLALAVVALVLLLGPFSDGDQVLLCTDGLSDMVDDALIEAVLNESPSAKAACQSLVDLALSNGGRDNITVVVARYSIPIRE